jgi:hypothetical protein
VKQRKKELAARARMIKRHLKETQPENYESIKKLVEMEIAKNNPWIEAHENFFDCKPGMHGPTSD